MDSLQDVLSIAGKLSFDTPPVLFQDSATTPLTVSTMHQHPGDEQFPERRV